MNEYPSQRSWSAALRRRVAPVAVVTVLAVVTAAPASAQAGPSCPEALPPLDTQGGTDAAIEARLVQRTVAELCDVLVAEAEANAGALHADAWALGGLVVGAAVGTMGAAAVVRRS